MNEAATSRSIGVCYYPEQWPQNTWEPDAARMAELGISVVRVGEFAWSQLEPARGDFRFDWLERSIDILAAAGHSVVMCTPTTAPPKWLVDEMPDMLPVGADGRQRQFGSRRHYCFSHQGYRRECARITRALAEKFGSHQAVTTWQTDNEYGCHETTLSYSTAARDGFRQWLAARYGTVEELNERWGNRFWSMEYPSFDAVELPHNPVAQFSPIHVLDFRRYSSDQVVAFNRIQVDILRELSPGRDIVHNFMGRILSFDHFDVGGDLDISSWDAYPLGKLIDRTRSTQERQRRFMRAGEPDFQAFHHDLYRATSKGRWWIMEQQPGPVNWAPFNPAPRDGMVRLWGLEAFAHGAETVSYFRWRQARHAQEQMHAGLMRPDGVEAPAADEVRELKSAIDALGWQPTTKADVAIIFDYPSQWAWEIQPHGTDFDYFDLNFTIYRALRGLGLSVDIVSSRDPDLAGRKLAVVAGLFCWNEALVDALRDFDGQVLIGPRSGSKTQDFAIPEAMPPDLPEDLLDITVTRVESIRGDCPIPVEGGGSFRTWHEFVEVGEKANITAKTADGNPAVVSQANVSYWCGWPDEELRDRLINQAANEAGIATHTLPDGVRLRRCGDHLFVFNYADEEFDLGDLLPDAEPILGETMLKPSGVTVFNIKP